MEKNTDEKKEIGSVEELHKEIDLIQGCITRMANNSFFIKGWLVSLIAVVVALFAETIDIRLLSGIILGISVVFWYLDAFYLKMETQYRWKYEWVIERRLQGDRQYLYDLNPNKKETRLNDKKEKSVIRYMFTKTLVPMYGLASMIAIILLISWYIGK